MNQSIIKIWLIFSILSAIAAFITLIPNPSSSHTNFIGYSSLCPIAPISTAILGGLSAMGFYARALIKKELDISS